MMDIFISGGPVMYPLLLCSIIVLSVIIERSIFWGGLEKSRDRQLLDSVLELARKGSWDEIRSITKGSRDHVVRVLVVGILHKEFDMAKAMEAEAEMEVKRMRKFMIVLDTMITVAPLLGIFGTVLGIITSFKMLGSVGIADPKLVTSGIAQALITTASGLGIAIIAVFPFNYFGAKVEHAVHVMEKYATSLEIVYEKLMQKEDKAV